MSRRSVGWRAVGIATLVATSTMAAVYAVEAYLDLTRPFERRSVSSRVAFLRQRGYAAYPAYIPSFRFRVPSGQMPLSGVRSVETVMASDDGSSITYGSDEFGFRNPPGLWRPGIRLALLGDSYVQGYNAPEGRDLAAVMRGASSPAVNLGMTGTGQLVQLAILREYGETIRPARVVIFYYEGNDIADTTGELLNPLLQRYYFEDDFAQQLPAHVDTTDPALRAFLDAGVKRELEQEARRNPPAATAGDTAREILELSGVRHLWSTTLQLWRLPVRVRVKRAVMDCATRYETLPMTRLEVDETHRTVRESPDDPRRRGPAIAEFLTREQLLLGRTLFDRPIRLLPWQSYRAILVKMRDLAGRWGGRLYFVYLPSHVSVADRTGTCDPNRGTLRDLVASAGIPWIDATEALAADPASFFIIHLTPAGYRQVARYVLEQLAALDRAG